MVSPCPKGLEKAYLTLGYDCMIVLSPGIRKPRAKKFLMQLESDKNYKRDFVTLQVAQGIAAVSRAASESGLRSEETPRTSAAAKSCDQTTLRSLLARTFRSR